MNNEILLYIQISLWVETSSNIKTKMYFLNSIYYSFAGMYFRSSELSVKFAVIFEPNKVLIVPFSFSKNNQTSAITTKCSKW